MLRDVIACLQCPLCHRTLARVGGSLRCDRGHTFDIARQGYVSMATGAVPAAPPDTPAMVAARAAFLAAGHFAPIARQLAVAATQAAADRASPCIVDIGAGTGYYLAQVLDRLPGAVGIALDFSKPALRRAARAHPRAGAVGCDVRDPLPVRTGCAGLVLDVFAPRNAPEMRRILHPDGALLVVTPAPEHLAELVTPLGLLGVDPAKRARLAAALDPHFRIERTDRVEFGMSLPRSAVAAVAGMGPSAWHADRANREASLADVEAPCAVTAAVEISTFRPR